MSLFELPGRGGRCVGGFRNNWFMASTDAKEDLAAITNEQNHAIASAVLAAKPGASAQLHLVAGEGRDRPIHADLVFAHDDKHELRRMVGTVRSLWGGGPLDTLSGPDLAHLTIRVPQGRSVLIRNEELPVDPRATHIRVGSVFGPLALPDGWDPALAVLARSPQAVRLIAHLQPLEPGSRLARNVLRRRQQQQARLRALDERIAHETSAPREGATSTDPEAAAFRRPALYALAVFGNRREADAVAAALRATDGSGRLSRFEVDDSPSAAELSVRVLTCDTADLEGRSPDFAELVEVAETEDLISILRIPLAPLGGAARIRSAGVPSIADVFVEPVGRDRTIELGRTQANHAFHISADDLQQHVLVSGQSGFGKSTTVRSLLQQASRLGIPFLVVDPSKEEYLRWPQSGGELPRGIALGNLNAWNPLACPEAKQDRHTGRFLDALDAAYSLSRVNPLGWVEVRGAVRRAYIETDGQPTLRDVYRLLVARVALLGSRRQDEAAAIRMVALRIADCVAVPAFSLDPKAYIDWGDLLSQPTVLSLGRVTGSQDRSFVMGLLIGELLTHREVEAEGANMVSPTARHILVIEEAHRLMTAITGATPGTSSQALTDGLAELRSTGQAIVLVEQNPSVLVGQALKGTATKICHRVGDQEEASLLAGSLGDAALAPLLTRLGVGEVVVRTPRATQAQWVAVREEVVQSQTAEVVSSLRGRLAVSSERDFPPFACEQCPSPCFGRQSMGAGTHIEGAVGAEEVVRLLQEALAVPPGLNRRWAEVYCAASVTFADESPRTFALRMSQVRRAIDEKAGFGTT